MQINQVIFCILVAVLTFFGATILKPLPIWVGSILVLISVLLMWLKGKASRTIGSILFGIILFMVAFVGSTEITYYLIPKNPVNDPTMTLFTWREIAGVVIGILTTSSFVIMEKRNKNKPFFVLLGAGSLTGMWLGFLLA